MTTYIFNINGWAKIEAENYEQALTNLYDEQLFNVNVDVELESEE